MFWKKLVFFFPSLSPTHPKPLNGGLVEGNILVIGADNLSCERLLWGLLQLLQETQQASFEPPVGSLPFILAGEDAVTFYFIVIH